MKTIAIPENLFELMAEESAEAGITVEQYVAALVCHAVTARSGHSASALVKGMQEAFDCGQWDYSQPATT